MFLLNCLSIKSTSKNMAKSISSCLKKYLFILIAIITLFSLLFSFFAETDAISPHSNASTGNFERGEIEKDLGLELGPGAGEVADMIAEELSGRADIFVYEASEKEPEGHLVVSTIMLVEDAEKKFIVHNLPLRTTIDPESAEELALAVNSGEEADYLWLNLSYFIEIVDLYDGVTVETATGPREMNTEEALDYLNHGLPDETENENEYKYDRLQRQEAIMWALEEEMEAHDGLPGLTGMLSLLRGGLREIETSLGLFRGIELGMRFIRSAPEDLKMYQPDAPGFKYE